MLKQAPLRIGDLTKVLNKPDIGDIYAGKFGVIVDVADHDNEDGPIQVKFGSSLDKSFGGGTVDCIEWKRDGRITNFQIDDLEIIGNASATLSIGDYTDLFEYLDPFYTKVTDSQQCKRDGCRKKARSFIWINIHGAYCVVGACDDHAKEFNGAWTEVFST